MAIFRVFHLCHLGLCLMCCRGRGGGDGDGGRNCQWVCLSTVAAITKPPIFRNPHPMCSHFCFSVSGRHDFFAPPPSPSRCVLLVSLGFYPQLASFEGDFVSAVTLELAVEQVSVNVCRLVKVARGEGGREEEGAWRSCAICACEPSDQRYTSILAVRNWNAFVDWTLPERERGSRFQQLPCRILEFWCMACSQLCYIHRWPCAFYALIC